MNLEHFGMDTISLAGPLRLKLDAMMEAGFTQVMLSARDVVGGPEGERAAIDVVRNSGLAVTGFQVLRDFEGLPGHLHRYKVDIAKGMLELCAQLGSRLLLVCSSTSKHATGDREKVVRDLRKLATLGVPLGIRIAYEALSWGRDVNEYTQSWDIVEEVNHPNFGIGIDSFHILASGSSLERLDEIYPEKIFLVQLADFMWRSIRSPEERIETARHFRVFPGEGVHSAELADLVVRLDGLGYDGAYSFEVFNDDYVQLPLGVVAKRARASASWLASHVPRRSLPRRRADR
ncbi:MAG: sugar phosphate isomerase/epimerase [Pseudomonadota bacterium]|nr:sugar phosphate isomerase/epimerase [Pseudomonadota bacterium]